MMEQGKNSYRPVRNYTLGDFAHYTQLPLEFI